jgi:hypothetical protein
MSPARGPTRDTQGTRPPFQQRWSGGIGWQGRQLGKEFRPDPVIQRRAADGFRGPVSLTAPLLAEAVSVNTRAENARRIFAVPRAGYVPRIYRDIAEHAGRAMDIRNTIRTMNINVNIARMSMK